MKRITIFVFLLLVATGMSAQEKVRKPIYLTGEMNFGNYFGGNLNLCFFLNEEYSLQLGASGFVREAKSKPDDYSVGFGIFDMFFSNLVFDELENYEFLAGKVLSSNQSGSVRWNFSLGLAYTVIREPTNWVREIESLTGYNYDYETGKSGSVSIIINPKIEFPFTRIIGFTISPRFQTNFKRAYIGFGVGVMAGLLK